MSDAREVRQDIINAFNLSPEARFVLVQIEDAARAIPVRKVEVDTAGGPRFRELFALNWMLTEGYRLIELLENCENVQWRVIDWVVAGLTDEVAEKLHAKLGERIERERRR